MLLEDEKERIAGGEPLEACLSTTLSSEAAQMRCCTSSRRRGGLLPERRPARRGAPVPHRPSRLPMFYSWLTPTHSYYDLALKPGGNRWSSSPAPTQQRLVGRRRDAAGSRRGQSAQERGGVRDESRPAAPAGFDV